MFIYENDKIVLHLNKSTKPFNVKSSYMNHCNQIRLHIQKSLKTNISIGLAYDVFAVYLAKTGNRMESMVSSETLEDIVDMINTCEVYTDEFNSTSFMNIFLNYKKGINYFNR